MLITVELRSDLPIYVQTSDVIVRQMSGRLLAPGDRLSAARSLAQAIDDNLQRVLRAYAHLPELGTVRRRQGGVAVCDPRNIDATVEARGSGGAGSRDDQACTHR